MCECKLGFVANDTMLRLSHHIIGGLGKMIFNSTSKECNHTISEVISIKAQYPTSILK